MKNRHGAESVRRARERYLEAQRLAHEAGLDPGFREIIERRLADLGDGAPE